MAKGGPTLFELMGGVGRVRPVSSTLPKTSGSVAPSTPGPPMDGAEAGFFSVNRSIRAPMGYVVVAAGVIVAALVMAFSMGYQSGQQSRDRQDAREMQASEQSPKAGNQGQASPAVIRDPLRSGLPQKPIVGEQDGVSKVAATIQPRSDRTPPTGDRRVAGMNYFIVAYCAPDVARRTVAYLLDSGVDAEAVSAHNGEFQYVISLKPFSAQEVGSGAYREHKALLKRLGRLWKRDHNGPDDFSEVWAQKYRPPRDSAGASQASATNP